jgi:hypothetical protein
MRVQIRRAFALGALLVWTFGGPASAQVPEGIWISRAEIASLPTTGLAWEAVVEASGLPASPDLSDQDDPSNTRVLAKALVAVRLGDGSLTSEVLAALDAVQGTEQGATALAVGRELMAYVIAADVIGLAGDRQTRFEAWLRSVRDRDLQGRTLRSTHEDRPNNWGTHAGASRLAVAIYLGDQQEIASAANVFRGWTGDAAGWQGFEFGDDAWQAGGPREFAVNPAGAMKQGHLIGGVLPDEQRRSGAFQWPPPKENYVYEALQGAVAQAVLLQRQGHDAWRWGDRAILRAFEWLHVQAEFPAQGDDTWIPWVVNRVYGTVFPAELPSQPGKGVGFSDWTHESAIPPPVLTP